MPSAAEQRESETTDFGTIARETVDNSAIAATAHRRLGAELAPDTAIGVVGDEHFAGVQSVNACEQQLVLPAGVGRADAWRG